MLAVRSIVMRFVTVHEAKTHLSRLIASVERGEEITISRGGDPVVRLLAVKDRKRRRPGSLKGQIACKPGAFKALTPAELKLWEAPD
jgi:prevent-host-death family protein